VIGDQRLRAALKDQAIACRSLGSPFMHLLCTTLAENLTRGTPLADRLFDWEGELGPRAESLPLRLCGALHALRLRGDETLAAVYPPHAPKRSELWAALAEVMVREAAFIDRFIDSAPQTNEVRRSAAILPAAHLVAARFGLPLDVMELGASAGLNLSFDRFALAAGDVSYGPEDAVMRIAPDWTGPAPAPAALDVARRAGVDLNPLDPADPADELRLLAYLWPDQPERLSLTRAAIAAAQTTVDKADAVDWLGPRLVLHAQGRTRFIYSTVAWQYLPPKARDKGRALIEEAGARADAQGPLAWFTMENDGTQPGAVLTLRLWPGDVTIDCGRADFHGRWIEWRAA